MDLQDVSASELRSFEGGAELVTKDADSPLHHLIAHR